MNLSIIITSYNKAKYIGLGLTSLIHQIIHYHLTKDVEIIIVDDNSTDHIDQYISYFQSRYPDIALHFYKSTSTTRTGNSAKHRNAGVLLSGGDHILLTDPEIIHCNAALVRGLDLVTKYPHYIISCPLYSLYPQQQISIESSSWDDLIDFCTSNLSQDGWLNAKFPTFHYWLMDKSDYIRLQGLEESFTSWGYEDTNFLERIDLAGLKYHFTEEFYAIHQNHNMTDPSMPGGDDTLNRVMSNFIIANDGCIANKGKVWGRL